MMTQHARQRCAQRGVRREFLASILLHADIDRPAGDNCHMIRVSRKKSRALNIDDRLARYALIVSSDSGAIVTVMPITRHTRHQG